MEANQGDSSNPIDGLFHRSDRLRLLSTISTQSTIILNSRCSRQGCKTRGFILNHLTFLRLGLLASKNLKTFLRRTQAIAA